MTEIKGFDKFDEETKITLLHNRSIDQAKRLDELEATNRKLVSNLTQIRWLLTGGAYVYLAGEFGIIELIKKAVL